MKSRYLLPFCLLFTVSACVHPGQNLYGAGEVGQSRDMVLARVLGVRSIQIKNQNTGVGMLAGGGAGAAIGSTSNNGWVTLGALVAGAIAGQVVENNVSMHDGLQYTVRTDDGKIKNIIQEKNDDDIVFKKGDRVMLEYCDAGDHIKKCVEGQVYQRVLPVPPEMNDYKTPKPKHSHKKKAAVAVEEGDAADKQ